MNADILYGFVMKGVLTDVSLDRTERIKKERFKDEEYQWIVKCLGINDFDEDVVRISKKMSVVYSGIVSFENNLRKFITEVLFENYKEQWWETRVSEKIKNKAQTRKEEESKYKYYTPRGENTINYIDFGDLFLIIKNNWDVFEPFFNSQTWVEYILKTIEQSRNVIMHGGDIADTDIERIGLCMRDWLKQTVT